MEHLYRKGLSNVSYSTLKLEHDIYFQTNDERTRIRRIGQPKEMRRYPSSTVIRQNVQESKVAQFHYLNERVIEHKPGLLEILGFATYENGRYTLHHERMSYYTHQTSLKVA